MNLFKRLWHGHGGAIVTAEFMLIASLLVVGATAGLTSVRNAVVTELSDVAQAFANVNQSYSFCGVQGCGTFTSGSFYYDTANGCAFVGTQVCVPVCASVMPNVPEGGAKVILTPTVVIQPAQATGS